ncbi:bifunctional UDP-N-acetylglucosamine 2-epimerase/N-acetylmannosamine kinase-like isoform X1 [Symsagittifera roscoffensis]|uniref:bifunctional UDP-N-acetylglucosamine 2-epimerase/N-acetylmannosamine kinase-like isoform X1 n=2 Tax=Symsagittifera roscoffensis TaxID=84072 RepID=UPI00307BD3BF
MKIAVATCNRADYSKLAPVLRGLKQDTTFQVSIVVMGSHLIDDYGNTYRFIERDGNQIDSMLHTLVRGETEGAMVESMGLAMIKLPDILNRLQPDLVMVHGDRFDAMSVAISAAVMNVRVLHLEGGEVSGTIDDVIRHSITKLAHYHICCTKGARLRIESMCEDSSRVLLAGCPAYDELIHTDVSKYHEAFERWLPNHVGTKNFIICVYHPVTTAIAESIQHFGLLLDALLHFDVRTVILFPNVDAGSKELVRCIRLRNLENHEKISCYKHVPFSEFVYLMGNCGLMIGNSSAGIRESNVFGTAVINIGTRQRGRQSGANVVHVKNPTSAEDLLWHIRSQFGKVYPRDYIYGDGRAVERIVKFIKEIDCDSPVEKSFNFDRNSSGLRAPSKASFGAEFPLSRQAHSLQLALAVDLGGSFIRVALVDDRGNIERMRRTEMVDCPDERIAIIVRMANDLLENKRDLVVGVGVSTGGRVNSETGEILFATKVLSGWGGVALKTRLQEQLGLPCYVENDGNCAALAEVHFGLHKMEDMVVLHFGTGIGGGIIQDGCLLNGSSYSAGEFGHIVVCFDDGPDCMCGNSGCVEAYAGGWALNKLAKEMELSSNWRKEGADDQKPVTPGQPNKPTYLTDLASDGVDYAVQHINRAVRAVASALLTIYSSYNPPVAILAGPLAPVYFDGVKNKLEERSAILGRNFTLLQSDMTEMSLKGAATLILNNPSRAVPQNAIV